jgi:threonine aldolase
MCLVEGKLGRIDPEELDRAIRRYPAEFVHHGQPMAVSITQPTELGTVYTLDEIRAISRICRQHGLPLHMDGARFANALAALDVSPAAMSVECGVDILSFGGTKNGCWCAEALVFFDGKLCRDLPFLRKRAGQLFSKSRFVAAQFSAYFQDGLWLETARWSNAMAKRLAEGFEQIRDIRLAWYPQANEVFAFMDRMRMQALHGQGAHFYEWPLPLGYDGPVAGEEVLCRFVTSFATTSEDINRFLDLAARQG